MDRSAPHQTAPSGADVINVADLLRRNAERLPERTALLTDERSVTWQELATQAHRVATGLVELGLVAGFRVAVALRNTPEFVAAYFGALQAGLVVVPANPASTPTELSRMLAHTHARAVFAGPEALVRARAAVRTFASDPAGAGAAAASAATGAPAAPLLIAVDAAAENGEVAYTDLAAARSRPAGSTPIPPADPEQLAVLLHTSGTSTEPRAVMLTHRALLANLDQLAAVDGPPLATAEDGVLGMLPFFHVFGLNAVLGLVVRSGASLLLADRPDAQTALELVRRHRVSNVPAAPPLFQRWARYADVKAALSEVRLLLCGAAPLPPETAARFRSATGHVIHQGYGLTEAAPVVTCTAVGYEPEAEPKPGSVGRPLPGVEVRVVTDEPAETVEATRAPAAQTSGGSAASRTPAAPVEPDDEPATAPVEEVSPAEVASAAVRRVAGDRAGRVVGEAVHRMTEQFANAAGPTSAVAGSSGDDPGEVLIRGPQLFSGYWPDGAGGPDTDGWFATGDVGYLDADGELFLVDRVKELVLVSGFNVYPREVEEVLETMDGVEATAVVAVSDRRTGEAVKAYVVPTEGAVISPEAVREYCVPRLAKFKWPTVVEVVSSLPRSPAGKIAKAELRRTERQPGLGGGPDEGPPGGYPGGDALGGEQKSGPSG